MGYYVPETMKHYRSWVLWKLEDGKKIPYSALYDGLASSTNPKTWSSYESAVTKLQHTDCNGLGFVFEEDSGLVFIDLDNCVNECGDLSGFAEDIIKLFPDTYIEYSQSETGLHIVCKGIIPRAYKSAEIELYSSGRYMAFTGNVYTVAEPAEAQAALDKLIKRYQLNADHSLSAAPENRISAADDEVINMVYRGGNAEQFRSLYAGEWEGKYKSQSEADLRLISILYYYSGNAEQVKRLFASSGLGQREKGRNSAYIQRTIQKAAENTTPRSAQARGIKSVTERRFNHETTTKQPAKRKYNRIF